MEGQDKREFSLAVSGSLSHLDSNLHPCLSLYRFCSSFGSSRGWRRGAAWDRMQWKLLHPEGQAGAVSAVAPGSRRYPALLSRYCIGLQSSRDWLLCISHKNWNIAIVLRYAASMCWVDTIWMQADKRKHKMIDANFYFIVSLFEAQNFHKFHWSGSIPSFLKGTEL